jgi:hypothetical protein
LVKDSRNKFEPIVGIAAPRSIIIVPPKAAKKEDIKKTISFIFVMLILFPPV